MALLQTTPTASPTCKQELHVASNASFVLLLLNSLWCFSQTRSTGLWGESFTPAGLDYLMQGLNDAVHMYLAWNVFARFRTDCLQNQSHRLCCHPLPNHPHVTRNSYSISGMHWTDGRAMTRCSKRDELRSLASGREVSPTTATKDKRRKTSAVPADWGGRLLLLNYKAMFPKSANVCTHENLKGSYLDTRLSCRSSM